MPFHILPKDFREAVIIKHKNKFYNLKEIFDLKCCFVQLSAQLAIDKLNISDKNYYKKLNEFTLVKQTAENDIYTDILNTIDNPDLTRLDIKKSIMLWLFSTNLQRKFSSKSNIILQSITKYFKSKFPFFFQFINTYKKINSEHKLKTNIFNFKRISKLSIDCFQTEANFIFNSLLLKYKQILDNIIISLHDGLYNINKFLFNNRYFYKKHVLNNYILFNNYHICGVNSLIRLKPG